jgi:hypothetical protein
MKLHMKTGPRKYEETALPASLRYFEAHDMLISATRYYIGRMTIQACHWAECLAKAWPEIPEGTRGVIRRDIEEAFRDDDAARERGDQYRPLGHDCDRSAWDKVRKAWQTMDATRIPGRL